MIGSKHTRCCLDFTHPGVFRATENKGLINTPKAGPHNKAALLFLVAHVLLNGPHASIRGGSVSDRIPQLMQVDALLSQIEQQMPLILADKHASDAALLFYSQPCQFHPSLQIVYPHLWP